MLLTALDAADFVSLSLVKTAEGWQANLNVEGGNSWRVRVAASPSEALSALFEPVPVWVPSLPPCPVALPLPALPY